MGKHSDASVEVPADAQPAPGPDPMSDAEREVPQDKEVLSA